MRTIAPALLLLGLAACVAAPGEGPEGPPASGFLARDFDAQAETDVGAALSVIDRGARARAGAADPPEISSREEKFLQRNHGSKISLEPERFVLDDFTALQQGLFGEPHGSTSQGLVGVEDFVISTLDRMPVRNQEYRGTCASFAGVGHLESYLLKKYPNVPAVDLAEQLFYYASKPECRAGGCGENEQGSLSEAGFQASIDGAFEVPEESSCTYRGQFGPDDVQKDYTEGRCLGGGVAGVSAIGWVQTPQEIYDEVRQRDVAVVVYTKLSQNWYDAYDVVTLADAGRPGDDMHAGGHAYLVVGARRVDIPGEGGMCFVVKNSWGQGWGQEGYACVTLAWFEAWRWDYPFPVVREASLSEDFLARYEGAPPDPTPDPDPNPGPPPDPTPDPAPPASWTEVQLAGDEHRFYRVEVRADGADFRLRGLLEDGGTTEALALELAGGAVLRKDSIAVGRAYEGRVELCTLSFRDKCQLSYFEEENRLEVEFLPYVEASEALARGLGASDDWVDVAPLGGSTLQAVIRADGVGLRAHDGARATGEPVGFALDPTSGEIFSSGKPVGSVSSGRPEVCSGTFASRCRLRVAPTGLRLFQR